MSYGIIRIQKFGATAVKGIEIHDQRKKDVSHTNPDIDRSESANNYVLYESESFTVDVKTRIQELDLKKTPRKDAVVMCQALITSDREFFDRTDKFHQEYFFKDALAFIQREYGPENIISATVHLDEKTPHMHVNFVPVTADGRLSAKSLLTRESLRNLQTDFYRQVGQKYDLERGESREDKRKHLDTEEFKQETRKAKIERFEVFLKEEEQKYKNCWDVLKRNEALLEAKKETIRQESAKLNLSFVPITEIEPEDLQPKILKKGLFSTVSESQDMIAERLSKKYVKPLAEIAKNIPYLNHELACSQKELKAASLSLMAYRSNYTELTDGLDKKQLSQLWAVACGMRNENRVKAEALELARREKEMREELKQISEGRASRTEKTTAGTTKITERSRKKQR